MVRSNRTFMELKFSFLPASLFLIRSSNRTFMELKFDYKGKTIDNVIQVLIAPLWN